MNWSFKFRDGVYSSLAVSNGMVYFGRIASRFYALYINTGAVTSTCDAGKNEVNPTRTNDMNSSLKWALKTKTFIFPTPIILNETNIVGAYPSISGSVQ